MTERLAALECALFGNGGRGLKAEVAVLDERTANMLSELTKVREEQVKSSRVLAMLAGGLVVLHILSALFIKFWKP